MFLNGIYGLIAERKTILNLPFKIPFKNEKFYKLDKVIIKILLLKI